MRIKKLLFVVLLFTNICLANASEISFVVYFTSGSVMKNAKTKIKKGDMIFSSDKISIAERSVLMLVCSNYKVIQLNQKGNYTAKNLSSRCEKEEAGYSSSYFKYVWNEFTHHHGKPETEPGEYMKNVGAVSRGCNTVSTGIPADTFLIGRGALPVYWASSFEKPIFTLYDVAIDGAPLIKISLQKDVPLKMEEFTKTLSPGIYYWQITDGEGNGCERNYLELLTSAAYQLKVDEFVGHIPNTTDAETAYLRGFILEENHLMAAAIASYTIAASLAPKNKLYKKTLSRFYATKF